MLLACFLAAAALGQGAPDEAAPEAVAPEAPAPAAAPPAADAPGPGASSPAPAPRPRLSPQVNTEKLARDLERLKRLPPDEAAKEAERIGRDLGQIKPPASPGPADSPPGTLKQQSQVPAAPAGQPHTEVDWVRDEARIFFTHMLAGDARSLVEHSAFPFQLEDRRVGSPEELMQEWLKALRSKRTDLMTLFGVEVLTPTEMEKKYGKPPARLSALPWKAPRTYVAIANLSGHAAVALLKDVGGGDWKVVGYHD